MKIFRLVVALFVQKRDGRWQTNPVAAIPIQMLLAFALSQVMLLIILQVAMWPIKIW